MPSKQFYLMLQKRMYNQSTISMVPTNLTHPTPRRIPVHPTPPKSGAPNSPKRKRARGRPRKLVNTDEAAKTKSLKELKRKFDSKTIAKQVPSLPSRSRREHKPAPALLSPFKHKQVASIDHQLIHSHAHALLLASSDTRLVLIRKWKQVLLAVMSILYLWQYLMHHQYKA